MKGLMAILDEKAESAKGLMGFLDGSTIKNAKPFNPMLWFFELLSLLDWITPSKVMYEDIKEGGPVNLNAWDFFIPYHKAVGRGWSKDHILDLLHASGVHTWGHLVNFGTFSFCVKSDQAAWVEYLLNRNEIPIDPKSQGAPGPERK